MAFNPFTSFRKYQKYWMAAAVLVCMTTFVLCSGGGKGTGLDDLLIQWFGGRRESYVKVNGTSYTSEEINNLKTQRNIANDFMRELFNVGIKNLKEIIKQDTAQASDKKDPEAEDRRRVYVDCVQDLFNKLHRDPRYFRGGNKLDDLVEFILWRDLAKKYDVTVTDATLDNFIMLACHGRLWQFSTDTSREVLYKVRNMHYTASDSVVINALKQEYLVQTVQLAVIARWSPANGYRDAFAQKGILLNTPMQFRIAPTPEQIATDYRKNRTELSVTLFPVSLDVLAKKEKLDDDPDKKLAVLKEFYDKYADKPYDPTKDSPGFLMKSQAKIQFFAADASMDYYKKPAQVLSKLEVMPPVAFTPLAPPLGGMVQLLAAPSAWTASLERNLGNIDRDRDVYLQKLGEYHKALNNRYNLYLAETTDKAKEAAKSSYEDLLHNPPAPHKYTASPWTTTSYYSPGQYKVALEKPDAVATLIGGMTAGPLQGLGDYQTLAYDNHKKTIAPMMPFVDRTKRIQAGVELFLGSTPDLIGAGNAFTLAALTVNAGQQPQFLPVAGFIEDELRVKIEEKQAQRWVNAVMLDVKRQLEPLKGKDDAFRDRVKELEGQYSAKVTLQDGNKVTIPGLIFGKTTEPRNEYDIETDEALKPLRDSFFKYRWQVNEAEDRNRKPEYLREWDFNKLFFGSEPLGVGPLEPFSPKIWPPYATRPKTRQDPLKQDESEIRMFDDALLPVIFWKSEKRSSEAKPFNRHDPKMVEFVEQQYRYDKARGKLLEEVKKFAAEVKKAQHVSGKDLTVVMRELAREHGTDLVMLNKVASLVENPEKGEGQPAYVEYALPINVPNRVVFPRPDMVKNLLALHGLTAPLNFDIKELDELNKDLFWKDLSISSKVGQVQILPNKSRGIYYIATVTDAKPPEKFSFFAGGGFVKEGFQSKFADQVQEDYAKELLQSFVQQMRTSADIDISKDAQKQFADEPHEK